MPHSIDDLLRNNHAWADRMEREHPGFFPALARQQKPDYLWIGCSDSRVPANQVVDLEPGEVFVHRNVANVVVPSDLNALSVVQFAVDVLQVKHILIVGHYGCGGVTAVLKDQRIGITDNWLRHVHDVKQRNAERLDHLEEGKRLDALCELNVIEQVAHMAFTTVVQDAWARGQQVAIHGWCYGLTDGKVNDLKVSMSRADHVRSVYSSARNRYPRRVVDG